MLCDAGRKALIAYAEKNLLLDFGVILTFPELLTKIFSDTVKGRDPAASVFAACKSCNSPNNCFFNLLATPKRLYKAAGQILSYKVLQFMEHAGMYRLKRAPWSNAEVAFPFAWLCGRRHYHIVSAEPLADGVFSFRLETPKGKEEVVVIAAETTEEFFKKALATGREALFVFYPPEKHPADEAVIKAMPLKAHPVWKFFKEGAV